MELIRAVLPATLTFVITMCVLTSLDWTGTRYGVLVMILTCPLVLGLAALTAWAVTVLASGSSAAATGQDCTRCGATTSGAPSS